MDKREERAIIIAATCRIQRTGTGWIVPSQTSIGKDYRVDPDGNGSCDCPDHAEGFCCKHIRAVRIVIKREYSADGTMTETKSITFTEKKKYTQNWKAYNAAQRVEAHRFQVLLRDLVQGIEEPVIEGRGRRPHSVRDSLFSMTLKVYSTFSSRRFSCDLVDAYERGYVSKPIPGMKVIAFMENPAFTPMLKTLIAQSALPLRGVERDFAIDSSGFSTSKFDRWFDEKYGKERKKSIWVKAHICSGVKTNVVTAVRILDKDSGDSPQFAPLVRDTGDKFIIREMSADKAYPSVENFEVVAGFGGTAFLAFKSSHTGAAGGLFEKMFHYFQYRQDDFLQHYHKRSNVESTFSMVKRKFGDAVRSKTETAMTQEVLCKFLCHNLCVLIQEQHELGIEPVFWKDEPLPEPEVETPAILPMTRAEP